MKTFFTIAFLAITTLASAQPGHYKDHGRGHYKNDHYKKHKKNKYKKDKHNHRNDCDYRVQREMNRYDFLRLSQAQRSKLQVSLNFLITNQYSDRDYERRLRNDLYSILTKDQYRTWENRAYRGGNTFVFNFGS